MDVNFNSLQTSETQNDFELLSKRTISKILRENVENGKVEKILFKRKFSEFILSRRKI